MTDEAATRTDPAANKWVGLVEVEQEDGVTLLGAGRGACVTTIAWCNNETEFEERVRAGLAELGLRWIEAEDVESCSDRLANFEVPDQFIDHLHAVGPELPVSFMDFHSFPIG